MRTLIAGDFVFNGVHVFLGEHVASQYDAWLESLDVLQAVHPARVIAGHRPGLPDDSFGIEWTRCYIALFHDNAKTAGSAIALADILHYHYPNAADGSGWISGKDLQPGGNR